jgi:small conductance mechanosensitive channel
MIVIVACVSMSILAEIGVNIGPLIAGAGIVGLAVGFGAQTLVKDVITGAFILLEDAISVGDLVEVAGHTGVVEAINIRSIRHRDLSGALHTVPFSVVDVVRNLSKDYSYYLTDVGVAYRENTDECVEIMREVLEEMRADPEWSGRILEPLEFMGIQGFGDSAVLLRVRIKTRPIEQFSTGREFNRRLKHAFDAHGIEIPFPHQTLYFGVDKEGRAPAGRLRIESGGSDEPDQSSQSGESHGRAAGPSMAEQSGTQPAAEPGSTPPSDREAPPPRAGRSRDDG